jgi:hypothetical protein
MTMSELSNQPGAIQEAQFARHLNVLLACRKDTTIDTPNPPRTRGLLLVVSGRPGLAGLSGTIGNV